MLQFFFLIILMMLMSCSARPTADRSEDLRAKRLLQGIWVDDESESVQFRIVGDTIYYPDASYSCLYFKVIADSLILFGTTDSTAYKMEITGEDSFNYHTLADDIISLHRSEDSLDSLAFEADLNSYAAQPTSVVRKDSVVMYQGHRYRGYVYINPSQIKVVHTIYSEAGMNIENVYYDNIIHICVYEGRSKLYSKDFYKSDFTELIPVDFFCQAILSDMDFMGVSSDGYKYMATLCIPDEASCYNIDVTISRSGELSLKNSVYP